MEELLLETAKTLRINVTRGLLKDVAKLDEAFLTKVDWHVAGAAINARRCSARCPIPSAASSTC